LDDITKCKQKNLTGFVNLRTQSLPVTSAHLNYHFTHSILRIGSYINISPRSKIGYPKYR